MMILYGCLWCGVILLASAATVKYIYPRYTAAKKSNDECEEEQPAKKSEPFFREWGTIVLIGIMVAFAVGCGMSVWRFKTEWISIAILLVTHTFLAVSALVDYKYYKIPNYCIIGMVAARAVLSVAEILVYGWPVFWDGIVECVITAVVGVIVLLTISKVTHGGIGYGDIKLMGGVAFLCGLRAFLYSFLLGMVFCAVLSIVLLTMKKKKAKDEVPMAPFIYMGFAVAIILGIC